MYWEFRFTRSYSFILRRIYFFVTESNNEVILSYLDAKDLIDTKQKLIRDRINQILSSWGQTSIEVLRQKAKVGELEGAENDAIALINQKQELQRLDNLIGMKK